MLGIVVVLLKIASCIFVRLQDEQQTKGSAHPTVAIVLADNVLIFSAMAARVWQSRPPIRKRDRMAKLAASKPVVGRHAATAFPILKGCKAHPETVVRVR